MEKNMYESIPKKYLEEIITSVTPLDDISVGGLKHTGLLLKLKNSAEVIIEHGKKYFTK
jgi:hypothetical protein